ncbi:MAG: serine hydroxymethyltransferase [Candidatus Omnitrophota bacterium]|nr:serine hydroxymethyltransferase [Candidatus Omnitrophota bacterium]
MEHLWKTDPEIYKIIYQETKRQHSNIELIASENFVSLAVLESQGSVLTNKYAEGYPNARWYKGCEFIDQAENLAIERAKKVFGAEHVNVQPHSGAQANMAVLYAALNSGDKILAMNLAHGGHLTHGHRHNFSGKYFEIIPYGVSEHNEQLDYSQLMDLAKTHRPKLIIAGASAYSRIIDFKAMREIADQVGALVMVDMAHIAGLIAAGIHPSPVPYAEFVTTTTHKTLRGPRAGMILCRKRFAKKIDAAVFPGIQGGPLMHVIAAKAVALKQVMQPEFKEYQKKVVRNAAILAEELAKKGHRIVSGGTDTHLFLMDLSPKDITGKDAADILDEARITVNKNLIPFDKKSPLLASGIRLGTPAVTTRGMRAGEMVEICGFIDKVLSSMHDRKVIEDVTGEVAGLIEKFPLYQSLRNKMSERL